MHHLPQNALISLDLKPPGTAAVGRDGERLAAEFLRRRGLRIVCTNFRTVIGRNRRGAAVTGEIDIVALDGAKLCFVEVKTRTTDDFASPVTAVDLRKQRQIIRAAKMYRRHFGIRGVEVRYDAVAVVLGRAGRPRVEHFKGYWNEAKFRKRNWFDAP